MEKLEIKHASVAERCEICHQSDLFDPVTEKCARCNNAITDLNKKDYVLFNKNNETDSLFTTTIHFGKAALCRLHGDFVSAFMLPTILGIAACFYSSHHLGEALPLLAFLGVSVGIIASIHEVNSWRKKRKNFQKEGGVIVEGKILEIKRTMIGHCHEAKIELSLPGITIIKRLEVPKNLANNSWFFEGAKLKILYENRDSYFIF